MTEEGLTEIQIYQDLWKGWKMAQRALSRQQYMRNASVASGSSSFNITD